MYETRQPINAAGQTTDLQQGDILTAVLLPELVTGASFMVRRGNSYGQAKTEEILAAVGGDTVKLFSSVKRREFAMVLSSTCDNFQSTSSVELAPIEIYQFDPEADTDAKRWLQVSADATGVGSPKLFYLPSNPTAQLPRSQVLLGRRMPLTHKYLERCFLELGAKRILGLAPAAQRHLQYKLALMGSRNAREDDEWPSVEDYRLKAAWLQEAIPTAGRRKARYEAELEELTKMLAGEDEVIRGTPVA